MTDTDRVRAMFREKLQVIAQSLDEFLNQGLPDPDLPGGVGFCIMVFPFAEYERNVAYIANTDANDLITILKDHLHHLQRAQAERENAHHGKPN